MKSKGTVLIIGGAEDRGNEKKAMQERNKEFEHFEILKEILPLNKGKGGIEIITTASGMPDEMREMYRKAFKKIGFTDIGFMDITHKPEARNQEFADRVNKSHAVFFSGGDQFKLAATLGGTPMVDVIRHKYQHDKDFVVAGTSAGAMALSKIMIYEGGVEEAILKDDLKITSGLGIFDTCIIDTHFIKRGRFGRLAHAIIMNPESLGIGLGEDTALVIRQGEEAQCSGSGMVVIIDGNEITQTNITEVDNGMPVYAEGLKVHLLAKGNKFSIGTRRMIVQKQEE